jgi:hypothetical protein
MSLPGSTSRAGSKSVASRRPALLRPAPRIGLSFDPQPGTLHFLKLWNPPLSHSSVPAECSIDFTIHDPTKNTALAPGSGVSRPCRTDPQRKQVPRQVCCGYRKGSVITGWWKLHCSLQKQVGQDDLHRKFPWKRLQPPNLPVLYPSPAQFRLYPKGTFES